MALDRFLSRSSGFASKAADQSLIEMGLQELSPSHYHRQVMHLCTGVAVPLAMKLVLPAARLSCDFSFRFFRRAATALKEDRCKHAHTHKQNVVSWLQMLQELKEQRVPSLNLISDASPKARMDVPRIPKVLTVSSVWELFLRAMDPRFGYRSWPWTGRWHRGFYNVCRTCCLLRPLRKRKWRSAKGLQTRQHRPTASRLRHANCALAAAITSHIACVS